MVVLEREQIFPKITITIESKEELRVIREIFNHIPQKMRQVASDAGVKFELAQDISHKVYERLARYASDGGC
jgi:hypothetical protein